MGTPSELVRILLVEDNPADIILAQESLNDAKVANDLHIVRDGEQAMRFLRREGDHAEAPRPDIVLLDLNLPRKDGREVLVEIKQDPELRRIPVIVLTTSTEERDILRAYDEHVNAYVNKPLSLDSFVEIVRHIDRFWLGVVQLPPR